MKGSVSPAVAVNLRRDGSPPYLHSFPFVLLADSLFPHLSRFCFMSDTKAFNQELLIYDSSERCNLRFSGGSPEKKKLGVSRLSNRAGGDQPAVIICILSRSDTQRFRAFQPAVKGRGDRIH